MKHQFFGTALLALTFVLASPPATATELRYSYSVEFEKPERHIKKAMKKKFQPLLTPLTKEVTRRQDAGDTVTCSIQIAREVHWLINYTSYDAKVLQGLEDLKESLKEKDQSWALEQTQSDGSWGACYKTWMFRLHASIDPLKELVLIGKRPKYPLKFLEPVNTPEKLDALYDKIIVSRLEVDGVSHRRDLNYVTSSLGQLLWIPDYAGILEGTDYPREEMADALIRIVDERWQNPKTGYWGAWYDTDGDINKSDDLSITFHIVAYRNGDVPHLDKIVETTLNLREQPYPYGWQDRGTKNNHHSYDVVKLLRYGWPYLDAFERAAVSAEISIMLARSLRLSMDGQGRFYEDAYDNVGDAYYFGVSFLDEAGFFRRSKLFWAKRLTFADSENVRQKIIANLKKLDSRDPMIAAALRKAEATD
ncbi:hypothetical protein NBZ79_07190 [Sneathiella marina]|uniref:Uncharacterized protein n=1 Tax=Sneathiella marina TaxID=2950108 RepID=A0ABY4W7E4_9PROT|nr:hypothetical protein [Sneathiella marina]USG62761.1 hypothetical protein NBZ79_07190 [Sneathiella marina]